jgi:hypothetical protein
MQRVLVSIHGTGLTEHDFWVAQRQAIGRHLPHPVHVRPVWWGDLIDAGASLPPVRDRLIGGAHTVARRLTSRPARYVPRLLSRLSSRLHNNVNGVAGVLAYFLPSRRREVIRQRLRQSLSELTRQGREIVLVSESLGSVVAFDVLRAEADRYSVATWMTLGCPLRLLVRSGQRRSELGAINESSVGAWLNLYAPHDPIAAPIASVFPAYPVQDERIEGSGGLFHAHGNYWSNPRVTLLIAARLQA